MRVLCDKFQPNNVRLVLELSNDDSGIREEFPNIIIRKCYNDPKFLNKIMFCDVATLVIIGKVNRHNCR